MQILLDLIYKHLKNKVYIIALIIGLLLINTACSENEYKVLSVDYEIFNYYYYKNDNNSTKLIKNYPLLKIGAKFDSDSIEIKNISLENESKSLSWDFEPKEITINNEKLIGIDNINLASYNFDSGIYNFIIYDSSSKKQSTTINIINNFETKPLLNISLKNDNLIISEDITQDYTNSNNSTTFNKNIILSYYDKNKNIIKSDIYNNSNLNENFPFIINLNKSLDTKYINLEFKDKNSINTIVLLEL